MDNETFKPSKDEEYQFSDGGDTSFSGAASTSKPNVLEQVKRKNLIIALVVIGIVFGIYGLVSIFSAPTTKSRPKPPPVSVATTPQIIPNPAPVDAPAAPKPEVASVTPAPTAVSAVPTTAAAPVAPVPTAAELNTRLTTVEERDAALQASVDKLNAQLTELQTTLSNLDARLSGLNDTVQGVAGQQAQMLAKEAEKHKRAVKAHAAPKPIYFIKAIVAGRAWLSTQNGGTITIGVGDNLPGYGTVQAIDINQGTVTTSAGAIIGYSPEDS